MAKIPLIILVGELIGINIKEIIKEANEQQKQRKLKY